MSNKLELYGMLQSGFVEKQNRREAEAQKNPGGDWRGGNSGCITEDGIILGESPRNAVLRHLGIEFPTTLDDDLIFDAGFRNEDHWAELLELSGTPIKQESEIPVSWSLPNGQTITGRPDIVVMNSDDSPKFGIELKLISSNGKMKRHSHFGDGNPIPYHVCQAAHYSHRLGVDWVLGYTSRTHFTSFYWRGDSWKFEHRAMLMDSKNDKPVSISPFISMYDISWKDDVMLLDGKPTIITASGIERFYQYCSDCVTNKVIPTHGNNVDIWGNAEKKPSQHVTYDDFAEASTESGFDEWITQCKEIVEVSRL